MDRKNRYNLIRIAAGDKWKIALYTEQVVVEYAAMPFALTNVHVSFQEMMYIIFKDVEGCIWPLADILIYDCNTEGEY